MGGSCHRKNCILSYRSFTGWNKAHAVFKDFLQKSFKINTIVSSSEYNANVSWFKFFRGESFMASVIVSAVLHWTDSVLLERYS